MDKAHYFDQDVDLGLLSQRTVAVVGYGTQGTARGMNMRDSGVNVIVGAEPGSNDWTRAEADGFPVMPVEEAARQATVFEIQVPDMAYRCADVYNEKIKPYHARGSVVCLSSAFNYYYNRMSAPDDVDAIVTAAKGPGAAVRDEYLKGGGVPALLAIHQNNTGTAKEVGLALCKAMGFTRVGVVMSTVEEETVTDLLGEHCSWGAIVYLVKAVFDVIVEAGYDPDTAFYEAINESKLTTDLIYKFGLRGMLERISNTAAYGALTVGPTIIDDRVKENIRKAMKNIRNGGFDKDWYEDYQHGYPKFNQLLKEIGDSQADAVGNRIREQLGVRKATDFSIRNV